MKKYFVLIASFMLFAASNAADILNLSNRVLNNFYGNYDYKKSCHITTSDNGLDNGNKSIFCMRAASVNVLDNTVYMLASGAKKQSNGNDDICHACAGLVEMFVFQPDGKSYKMIARKQVVMGSYGQPSAGEFLKLGPNTYGWSFDNGFTNQGVTEGGATFYAVLGKSVKEIGYIPTIYDNSGFSDKNITSLEGKINVNTADNDGPLYPLKITFTGEEAGKKTDKKIYLIKFDERTGKYVLPENYPIKH